MKVKTELRKYSESDTLGWTSRLPDESLDTNTCVHHWVIELATGPASKGRCKYCGEERLFQNYWNDDAFWERSSFLLDSS